MTTQKYTAKTAVYALNTPSGVRSLLRDRAHLGALRESGDTAASDILIDLDRAIMAANITDRQAEAIAYVYGLDMTRGQAAAALGITRPAVDQAIWAACRRIAAVYRDWNYGEVIVSDSAA